MEGLELMKGEAMLDLKSCPRCKGGMYTESDSYGKYRQCWQCGFLEDVSQEAVSRKTKGRELVGIASTRRSSKKVA